MKISRLIKSFLLGFVLLLSGPALNQNVEAFITVPSDSILVGQRLPLDITINLPEQFTVRWPKFGDTLIKNIEILKAEEPARQKSSVAGQASFSQRLYLTSFDTGFYYLPAIPVEFSTGPDTVFYQALTNPLMIYVGSVDVDTAGTFKPIKDNVSVPLTFAEVLPWIIGILGLALLIFLILRFVVRRGSRLETIAEKIIPTIPPHIHALNELEELRHSKLWQSGQIKLYYTRLSEIVRVYLENQFSILAVEMTTDEILGAIRPLEINAEATNKLSTALQLSDLVKFAKAQPSALEHEICLQHMIDFVQESYGNLIAAANDTEEDFTNDKQVNR